MNFQCAKSASRCFCKGTIIPILPLYPYIYFGAVNSLETFCLALFPPTPPHIYFLYLSLNNSCQAVSRQLTCTILLCISSSNLTQLSLHFYGSIILAPKDFCTHKLAHNGHQQPLFYTHSFVPVQNQHSLICTQMTLGPILLRPLYCTHCFAPKLNCTPSFAPIVQHQYH